MTGRTIEWFLQLDVILWSYITPSYIIRLVCHFHFKLISEKNHINTTQLGRQPRISNVLILFSIRIFLQAHTIIIDVYDSMERNRNAFTYFITVYYLYGISESICQCIHYFRHYHYTWFSSYLFCPANCTWTGGYIYKYESHTFTLNSPLYANATCHNGIENNLNHKRKKKKMILSFIFFLPYNTCIILWNIQYMVKNDLLKTKITFFFISKNVSVLSNYVWFDVFVKYFKFNNSR